MFLLETGQHNAKHAERTLNNVGSAAIGTGFAHGTLLRLAMPATPNFFMWGSWTSKTIRQPFLTSNVGRALRKIVLGDTFVVALTEKGQVLSWGTDTTGCLGLGTDTKGHVIDEAAAPCAVEGLEQVIDIQMGSGHLVALNNEGEVFCWGRGSRGQLGTGETTNWCRPTKVDEARFLNEQIMQIAVLKNSTFALSYTGVVYAWGDNTDNVLGLRMGEDKREMVEWPTVLTLLSEWRVTKLDILGNITVVAYVADDCASVTVDHLDMKDPKEAAIVSGITMMRDTMDKVRGL